MGCPVAAAGRLCALAAVAGALSREHAKALSATTATKNARIMDTSPLRGDPPDVCLARPARARSPRGANRELDLTRRARAGDLAESIRERVADASTAELRLQVGGVEEIEDLGEEIDLPSIAEAQRLADAHVHDVDAGAVDVALGD